MSKCLYFQNEELIRFWIILALELPFKKISFLNDFEILRCRHVKSISKFASIFFSNGINLFFLQNTAYYKKNLIYFHIKIKKLKLWQIIEITKNFF